MATYYATCHTPDNFDADRRIQGLGGAGWWYTIDQIITMLDQGHLFYTRPQFALDQQIITAIHPTSRRRYIKTVADGLVPNNILSLPHCTR